MDVDSSGSLDCALLKLRYYFKFESYDKILLISENDFERHCSFSRLKFQKIVMTIKDIRLSS